MPASLPEQLDRVKGQFGAAATRDAERLLNTVKSARFTDPLELVHLHETLLFLRAYPQSARVVKLADEILFSFGRRLRNVPLDEFEYAEVSGVARTSVSTAFSYPFALSLSKRHGKAIEIDWTRYEHPERIGRSLAKLIPEAFEAWAIEPHADWQRWYEKPGHSLLWFLERVDPEVYDLLEIPLRWKIGDATSSRTRLRIPRTRIFYHDGPLLARKDVSIKAEFAKAKFNVRKVPAKRAQQMIDVIVDASAVRYRELYGFEYPDASRVFHADLGRGADFFFCSPARKWKLPRREYVSGMYFKNGVPAGYVEVMWAGRRMEVGFNLYYTFRQGETAWLYARLLKLFHERFGVTEFVIDPYQIGHKNAEAIDSGAFWFYYKLGFRPEARQVAKIAEAEARKAAVLPHYRTAPRRLRELAKSSMVLPV